MSKSVEEYLALAAACRAKAESEKLVNVRQLHLEAAVRWETLAAHVLIANPCEQQFWRDFGAVPASEQHVVEQSDYDRRLRSEPIRTPAASTDEGLNIQDPPALSTEPHSCDVSSGTVATADELSVRLFAADGGMRTLAEIEADVIRHAIGFYRRRAEVARRLHISRSTLYRKLSELGIECTADDPQRLARDGVWNGYR